MKTSVKGLLRDLLSGGSAEIRTEEALIIPIDSRTTLGQSIKQLHSLFDDLEDVVINDGTGKGKGKRVKRSAVRDKSKGFLSSHAGAIGSIAGIAAGIAVGELGTGISKTLESALEVVKENASDLYTEASKRVAKGMGVAGKYISELSTSVERVVRDGWTRAQSFVADVVTKPVEYLKGATMTVAQFFGFTHELPDKLIEPNSHPTESMTSRIAHIVATLFDSVKVTAKSWLDSILKFLTSEPTSAPKKGAQSGTGSMQPSVSGGNSPTVHGGGNSPTVGGSGTMSPSSRGGHGGSSGRSRSGGGTGGYDVNVKGGPEAINGAMSAAMDQLRKEGVPEKNLRSAAAMLTGQAMMESGLNPNTVHDNDTGFGIYGARNDRRDDMFNWLDKNGYARNSLDGQMRYMAHEAMTKERFRPTRDALMNATPENMGAQTDAITHNFEAPLVENNRSGAVDRAYRTGPTKADEPKAESRPAETPTSSTDSGIQGARVESKREDIPEPARRPASFESDQSEPEPKSDKSSNNQREDDSTEPTKRSRSQFHRKRQSGFLVVAPEHFA